MVSHRPESCSSLASCATLSLPINVSRCRDISFMPWQVGHLILNCDHDRRFTPMAPNRRSSGSLYTCLHSPVGVQLANYQLLCVFDCQSTDFANKTGESEYSQEMVERSFWESKKIPKAYTRTLSLSTVQIVRHLQDFLFPQVSRLRELRSWIHDQIKFQSEQIKWTNYWNHFFI